MKSTFVPYLLAGALGVMSALVTVGCSDDGNPIGPPDAAPVDEDASLGSGAIPAGTRTVLLEDVDQTSATDCGENLAQYVYDLDTHSLSYDVCTIDRTRIGADGSPSTSQTAGSFTLDATTAASFLAKLQAITPTTAGQCDSTQPYRAITFRDASSSQLGTLYDELTACGQLGQNAIGISEAYDQASSLAAPHVQAASTDASVSATSAADGG